MKLCVVALLIIGVGMREGSGDFVHLQVFQKNDTDHISDVEINIETKPSRNASLSEPITAKLSTTTMSEDVTSTTESAPVGVIFRWAEQQSTASETEGRLITTDTDKLSAWSWTSIAPGTTDSDLTSPTQNTTPDTIDDLKSTPTPDGALGAPAIFAIVAGSVGGLALIILSMFCICKPHRQNSKEQLTILSQAVKKKNESAVQESKFVKPTSISTMAINLPQTQANKVQSPVMVMQQSMPKLQQLVQEPRRERTQSTKSANASPRTEVSLSFTAKKQLCGPSNSIEQMLSKDMTDEKRSATTRCTVGHFQDNTAIVTPLVTNSKSKTTLPNMVTSGPSGNALLTQSETLNTILTSDTVSRSYSNASQIQLIAKTPCKSRSGLKTKTTTSSTPQCKRQRSVAGVRASTNDDVRNNFFECIVAEPTTVLQATALTSRRSQARKI